MWDNLKGINNRVTDPLNLVKGLEKVWVYSNRNGLTCAEGYLGTIKVWTNGTNLKTYNSLQKFWQNENNYEPFDLIQANKAINCLCDTLGIEKSDVKLKYFEGGFCFATPRPAQYYIDQIQHHFDFKHKHPLTNGLKFIKGNLTLIIYDKSTDPAHRANAPPNAPKYLLRIEIRVSNIKGSFWGWKPFTYETLCNIQFQREFLTFLIELISNLTLKPPIMPPPETIKHTPKAIAEWALEQSRDFERAIEIVNSDTHLNARQKQSAKNRIKSEAKSRSTVEQNELNMIEIALQEIQNRYEPYFNATA